jgi:hypothetical protein
MKSLKKVFGRKGSLSTLLRNVKGGAAEIAVPACLCGILLFAASEASQDFGDAAKEAFGNNGDNLVQTTEGGESGGLTGAAHEGAELLNSFGE